MGHEVRRVLLTGNGGRPGAGYIKKERPYGLSFRRRKE